MFNSVLSAIKKILIRYTNKNIKFSIPEAMGKTNWHLATNVLFMIPEDQHSSLIEEIQNMECILEVEKAGRGFINMKFTMQALQNHYHDIKTIGQNEKINVEFSSPNPTGPMHLGHWRGTFIGSCIANLLKCCGYDVTSDMYINNAGSQFTKFLETIDFYKGKDNCQVHYIGEYVKDYAARLKDDYKPEDVTKMMINQFKKVLAKANIVHDVVTLETEQLSYVQQVEEVLKKRQLLLHGTLENQKSTGNVWYVNAESYGENNFVFKKNDGKYTYAAYDCGYVMSKGQRGFRKQFCLVGEDHMEHIRRIPGIMNKLDYEFKADYVGIVTFKHNGEIVKFSKRNGKIITLNSMLDKRYYGCLVEETLLRSMHENMEIDLENMTSEHYLLITNTMKNITLTQYMEMNDELARLMMMWPIVIHQQSLPRYDIHSVFKYTIHLCKYLNRNRIFHVNQQIHDILSACKIICGISY